MRILRKSKKNAPVSFYSEKELYIKRRIEESSGYFGKSFSNRYANWRRYESIIQAIGAEVEKTGKNKNLHILEIGCGEAWMIFRLKNEYDGKYNVNFTGIDLSDFEIDFAKRKKKHYKLTGCDFHVMDATSLKFKGEAFDAVICSEVIEHIPDPVRIICEIKRVLKKNGLAVLTTPNSDGNIIVKGFKILKKLTFGMIKVEKEAIVNKLVNKQEKKALDAYTIIGRAGLGHVSEKSRREWLKLFKNSGFKIEAAFGTGGMFFGDPVIDKHRFMFGFSVIFDTLTKCFSLSYLWSETAIFQLRKR
ncbi:MAG: hypothetical protein A2231_07155 [Candidatus Firestonebacteria bacterium RIFOXYA2_FULL_40_8]|nr:MAG: hypothetical protein A2231_07155 [Candidatus Firestonebacteria bacterium RIFOXYA2_FULL_40_8]